MKDNKTDDFYEKRTEPRTIIDKYYSVQFVIEPINSVYQFSLWDISTNGMCILIEEDSDVLNYLKVGDVFRMKYYPVELLGQTKLIKTEIRHITKGGKGRFKKCFKVGLAILEKY